MKWNVCKRRVAPIDVGSDECVQDLCEEIDFLRREIARLKSLLKKKNKSFEGGEL